MPLQCIVTPTAIDAVVQRIVDGFQPEQVILFGSRARGDARGDSDVDLLVVMPFAGSKREKRMEIAMAVGNSGVPTDIVVVTPDEVSRLGHLVGTIIRPALREGKVLYQRGG